MYDTNAKIPDALQLKQDFCSMIENMRARYEKIMQSYIGAAHFKKPIPQQYNMMLERLLGKRLRIFMIDPYFIHKLLEYVESDMSKQPSLKGFARFLGMELGNINKAISAAPELVVKLYFTRSRKTEEDAVAQAA